MRFNINAPFWRFMDTLLRFVGLNLVYLITLIPNVTIGPARAALYSTMFAYDEHDDIRLVKEYLTRFKREFKQGLAAWVLVAILAAAILFGLSFWKAWDTNAPYIPLILLVIAAVVVALFAEYAAPLQARFANTTGRLFSLSAMFPLASLPLLARPRRHRRTRGRPVIFRTVHTRSRHPLRHRLGGVCEIPHSAVGLQTVWRNGQSGESAICQCARVTLRRRSGIMLCR